MARNLRACVPLQIKQPLPGTWTVVHDGTLNVGGKPSVEGGLMAHILYLKGNLRDCTARKKANRYEHTGIDKRFKIFRRNHEGMTVVSCAELACCQGAEQILVGIKFYGS